MKYRTVGLLAFFILLSVSVTAALPEVEIYAWTDKASYQAGGRGTLYITIKNDRDDAITIYNITVIFPWQTYVEDHWEGNITIEDIDEAIPGHGKTYSTEVEFSVPNDGRAVWGGTAGINVMTDARPWPYSGGANIPVALMTTSPLTNNLIIILIAIVLVCTGAIIAMIYWAMKSMTKPQIARTP